MAVAGAALTALLAVATAPVAAADGSVTGELIRGLNERLLYIAVPIALLVEFILLYTVWRFRDGEPRPTRENKQLEITWTIATALVLLFVGTASYTVLSHPFVATVPDPAHGGHSHGGAGAVQQPGDAPPDAVEVRIVAQQWFYTFEYVDAGVTTRGELVVPTNRTLYLYVTSEDVLHSVHVPAFALKQDAFPGQYNLVRTRLTEPATARMYCAEYCGQGHPRMRATVEVVSPGAYERWLDEQQGAAAGGQQGNATDGRRGGHP